MLRFHDVEPAGNTKTLLKTEIGKYFHTTYLTLLILPVPVVTQSPELLILVLGPSLIRIS